VRAAGGQEEVKMSEEALMNAMKPQKELL